ncbi:sulfurtransferase-like selenium metabolism protein YedF [Desulfolutivibrio sulfoxidireducens]|uniref:sulfurtransferase-like selenium metabolism protein YedF n=1 Tax=Desulfolutivibrio sulfoxidireducens TaxID=2773299 RepID=UPI00159E80EA|nr:sulfurtransferase-like selenium metabolism protein YedF [Desulfolutivibrio sulfoxidireducens]QLA16217.1 sulfurtransferase-like selenium metabolism protein YedF [Desulfolutivibrio sulfoxidireducens]QLA19885.1 sulfurtransferase-like selenium metabolism protein YedF [Desulfolutivibrio sulfoxidireducens]
MNSISLDCRGLSCPGPVLRCKDAIESASPSVIAATVDNEAARENVARFLTAKGYAVDIAPCDGGYVLTGTRDVSSAPDSPAPVPHPAATEATREQIVAFMTADAIGRGDDTLGARLMVNFLATLPELGDSLWRIVMVNGAVKLAVTGSPVLDRLKAFEAAGVTILVCGTCLDFFGLLDQKEVGQTTNMLDVVTSLQLATKVLQV